MLFPGWSGGGTRLTGTGTSETRMGPWTYCMIPSLALQGCSSTDGKGLLPDERWPESGMQLDVVIWPGGPVTTRLPGAVHQEKRLDFQAGRSFSGSFPSMTEPGVHSLTRERTHLLQPIPVGYGGLFQGIVVGSVVWV